MDVYLIGFRAGASSLEEANRLFLRAVGLIRAFNDSLLGKNPKCDMSIDEKEHIAMRKFRNTEGLTSFIDYMSNLVHDSPEPKAKFLHGEDWFVYGTKMGDQIGLFQNKAHEWEICGIIKVLSSAAVTNGLEKEGFKAHIATA